MSNMKAIQTVLTKSAEIKIRHSQKQAVEHRRTAQTKRNAEYEAAQKERFVQELQNMKLRFAAVNNATLEYVAVPDIKSILAEYSIDEEKIYSSSTEFQSISEAKTQTTWENFVENFVVSLCTEVIGKIAGDDVKEELLKELEEHRGTLVARRKEIFAKCKQVLIQEIKGLDITQLTENERDALIQKLLANTMEDAIIFAASEIIGDILGESIKDEFKDACKEKKGSIVKSHPENMSSKFITGLYQTILNYTVDIDAKHRWANKIDDKLEELFGAFVRAYIDEAFVFHCIYRNEKKKNWQKSLDKIKKSKDKSDENDGNGGDDNPPTNPPEDPTAPPPEGGHKTPPKLEEKDEDKDEEPELPEPDFDGDSEGEDTDTEEEALELEPEVELEKENNLSNLLYISNYFAKAPEVAEESEEQSVSTIDPTKVDLESAIRIAVMFLASTTGVGIKTSKEMECEIENSATAITNHLSQNAKCDKEVYL